MSTAMHGLRTLILHGAAVTALASVIAVLPTFYAQAQSSIGSPADLVRRGAYIATAADCMTCHTVVGGPRYAGGLVLETPFGPIASPNITPDHDTGIGGWTDDQFYRVIHDGIGPGHQFIYPVMSFTSYTKMTRQDVDALHAYLMSLPPVHAPRLSVGLHFPFNIRLGLLPWRALYFRPATFRPDPARSAQYNRGAYLVEGAGHCGECHTPRNAAGAMIKRARLSGTVIDSFLAPNISSDPRWGIGAWSEDELTKFLQTGASHRGVVFGPMVAVVHESLAGMTEPDVRAIAFYLKNTPPRSNQPPPFLAPSAAAASVGRGQAIYQANCSQCHQEDGTGAEGAIPNLAGNDAIRAADPTDAMMPVLAGLQGQGDYGAMPRFGGALDDQEIADLANYIRTAWGNAAPENATPAMVAALRTTAAVGIGGSSAARSFGCGKIGDTTVPGALASEDAVQRLARANPGSIGASASQDSIAGVIAMLRHDNPDASGSDIVNSLNAAYCPVAANRRDLDDTSKARALIDFSSRVGQELARTAPSGISSITVDADLTPQIMARIRKAAAAAGMTPSAFISQTLSSGAK